MSVTRWTYIPDILEEHIEEIAILRGHRQEALRSHVYTFPRFCELDERIEGHRDGVRAVGREARAMLEEKLISEDALDVFAGALGLLDPAVDGTARVLEMFAAAEGAALTGVTGALCHAGAAVVSQVDETRQTAASPATAIAACEILTFQRVLERRASLIEPFLRAEDPLIRRAGWRVVACAVLGVHDELYSRAMADEDPMVRLAALEAGAWCGAPQILTSIRELAATAPLEHSYVLPLLAIIATDADRTLIEALGCMEALGPMRFALLGTGGDTRFVEHMLSGMESADPKTAVAAGAAFTKLTGLNIDSQNVATVPPEGEAADDEFDQEFGDQLTIPDPVAARREWKALIARNGVVHHMAAGRSLDTLDAATFNVIDMQSRYEICLRSRFHGLWTGTPVELERFPQRRV